MHIVPSHIEHTFSLLDRMLFRRSGGSRHLTRMQVSPVSGTLIVHDTRGVVGYARYLFGDEAIAVSVNDPGDEVSMVGILSQTSPDGENRFRWMFTDPDSFDDMKRLVDALANLDRAEYRRP